VKELSEYPNREPGLGSWQDWEEKEKQLDFVDPYIDWLRELELNPKLDLSNYYRDNNYRKWNWVKITFIFYILAMAIPNLFWMLDFSEEGLFMPWDLQRFLLVGFFLISSFVGLVSYFFYRRQ
jgi:hypothetical protein